MAIRGARAQDWQLVVQVMARLLASWRNLPELARFAVRHWSCSLRGALAFEPVSARSALNHSQFLVRVGAAWIISCSSVRRRVNEEHALRRGYGILSPGASDFRVPQFLGSA